MQAAPVPAGHVLQQVFGCQLFGRLRAHGRPLLTLQPVELHRSQRCAPRLSPLLPVHMTVASGGDTSPGLGTQTEQSSNDMEATTKTKATTFCVNKTVA